MEIISERNYLKKILQLTPEIPIISEEIII